MSNPFPNLPNLKNRFPLKLPKSRIWATLAGGADWGTKMVAFMPVREARQANDDAAKKTALIACANAPAPLARTAPGSLPKSQAEAIVTISDSCAAMTHDLKSGDTAAVDQGKITFDGEGLSLTLSEDGKNLERLVVDRALAPVRISRAAAYRLDGVVHGAVGCHHDHRGHRVGLLQFLQELEAVEAGPHVSQLARRGGCAQVIGHRAACLGFEAAKA